MKHRTFFWFFMPTGLAMLLFIALPAYWHGIMWIGALLWVGFTAAGLAWCIQYERTEPLDRP